MTVFLLAAAFIVAVTLALLSRPWWRRSATAAESRRALNAAIYRDQLAEVEKDRASGELGDEDYRDARAELQRRLLDDTGNEEVAPAGRSGARSTLWAMVVALPLIASGLYLWLGTPAALDKMARRDFTANDIEEMVSGLAARLEKEPENYRGWAMLARSYKAMRRYELAEQAFEKAMPVVEHDAQLLADLADLVGSRSGSLEGRPEQLLQRALAVDPDNLQALWLAGTAAFARNDFGRAAQYWQRGRDQMEAGSDEAEVLDNIIAEARQKLADQSAGAGGKRAISGRVELVASLKGRVAPDDTVFIIARASDGNRMPLAVERIKAARLPYDFRLDDSKGLSAERRLSSATAVEVEARVSRSGDAIAKPGDLRGSAGSVKVGTSGVRIRIDTPVL